MKKYKVSNLFTVAVFACVALFASCSDDDKEAFVPGDTTQLKKDLVVAYDSLNLATPDKYTQESVDDFKTKLDLISSIVDKGGVSEQEVINMNVHLDKSFTTFLNSRMYGIPAEFLIAGWGFDEGTSATSTIESEGVNKLIATLKTGPTQIFGTNTQLPQFVDEGINGKAIYLDKGAHLEIDKYTPGDFLGKQLTIAVWLKPEVVKGGNYVASLNYWNNWKFQIQEQAKAFFTIGTTAGTTDADNEKDLSVPKNTWTHVVIVLNLDESTLSFYVNGLLTKEWTKKEKPALVGSQNAAYQSPLGVMLPLMIGASTTYEEAKVAWNWGGWDTPTGWDYFQGAMDEFKFYNTAISSGQVKWLYNKEAALLQ